MPSGRRAPRRPLVVAACALGLALNSGAKTPVVAQGLAPASPQSRPARRAMAVDAAVEQLRKDLLAETTTPGVRRGVWGIVVQSLDRDERLFELNPSTLLVPASIAKLVSAASASETVGWDHTFETTLRATGPVVDGVLTGDLLVVGSGDPSVSGRAGDDLRLWVDALKASGLTRIDGRIVGDDDALEEPRPALSWGWDDLGYTSGALFGALNAYENRMIVTVTPGARDGDPTALGVPSLAGGRPLINRTTTSAASTQLVWPEQRPGEGALTIAGFVKPGGTSINLPVSVGNPTLWFASVLRDQLVRGGIEVTGDPVDVDDVLPPPDRASAALLYTHRSRPLSALIVPMLKESVNLYGEAVMRLNAAPGLLPTNDAALDGLKRRMAAWGVPADALQIIDGSGLSRRDVIAPEAMLVLLTRMFDATGQSPFMTALPVAGVDGSLRNRMKDTPAEGNVRAKTGTMSNVRTLAGYVTTRDGEHLALVIMANNFEGTGMLATQVIDRMTARLAGFSRTP